MSPEERRYRYSSSEEAYRVARRRIVNNALRRGQRSLDLSNYGLTELPTELSKLKTLRFLHVSGNKLTQLPDFIGDMVELTGIYAARNNLVSISGRIGQCTKLRYLDFEQNELTNLPKEMEHLSALGTLDLGYNNFNSIPDCIFSLPKLEDLVLQDNSLREVSSRIGNLRRLESLDLDNNELITLPAEIGQLSELISLYIRENQLTLLPNEIGQLRKLLFLAVSGNRLTSLPKSVGDMTKLADADLADNNISSIPAEISNLLELEDLDLSNNELSSLPHEIGALPSLRRLNIGDNEVNELPASIGLLSNLNTLIAANNRIKAIPAEIGGIPGLLRLDMSSNSVSTIPSGLTRIRSLRSLKLNKNNIKSLPQDFDQLIYLQTLEIENNGLTELPPELGKLRGLERAALNYNPRTKRSQGGLFLKGNPLGEPYPSLVAMGQPSATVNVLAWLRGEIDSTTLPQEKSDERDKRLDAEGPTQPRIEVGPHLVLIGGQFELANETPPEMFHGEVIQRVLHKRLLRQIELLKFEAERFNNQYPELAQTILEYDSFAGQPFEDIDVINLWAAGNALIAHVVAVERQQNNNGSSLEPHQFALLSEVTRLHGGFILGFPEGIELTERADKALSSPDLATQISEPTATVLSNLASQEQLVSEKARNFVEVLESALHVAGWSTTRAGYGAYTTIRNFLIEMGKVIVLFDEKGGTVSGGALISGAIATSGITPQTLMLLIEFLHANSAPILAFAAPFPELRTWIQWIIDHLDSERKN